MKTFLTLWALLLAALLPACGGAENPAPVDAGSPAMRAPSETESTPADRQP